MPCIVRQARIAANLALTFFVIPQFIGKLVRDFLCRCCSAYSILQIICCLLIELDQPIDSPDIVPTFVIKAVDLFHCEEYQNFFFPNFFCPFQPQPRIIFSEQYIHLEVQGIHEDFSFQTEFFLVHVKIMTHFRIHDPFFPS